MQQNKISPSRDPTQTCCSSDIFRQRTSWTDDSIEQASSPSARAAHPHERNAAGAPEKPAVPTGFCWRVYRHERDRHHLVLRPSANHPCCPCASSSGSSPRQASQGNACHVSHASESCASHSVCKYFGYSYATILPPCCALWSPTGSAKRCQLTRLAVSPPCFHPPGSSVSEGMCILDGQITKPRNK